MGERLEYIYPVGDINSAPTRIPENRVREIGFRGRDWVDAIYLNGQYWGGRGGQQTKILVLDPGEWVNRIDLRHRGSWFNYLKFTTNKGRDVSVGGPDGTYHTFDNIELLTIAGNVGSYVNYLEFRMIVDKAFAPKPFPGNPAGPAFDIFPTNVERP